ncbi:hypothetical protein TNCV_3808341 [Trichonephila clavipes]|nr:hypothetical protein TNCV_3808341 [Trichonephila clavipes]
MFCFCRTTKVSAYPRRDGFLLFFNERWTSVLCLILTVSFSRNPNPLTSVGVNMNVTLFSYTKAFGDGPRHFEPYEEDIWAGRPSSNYPTKGMDIFNVHWLPLQRHQDPKP